MTAQPEFALTAAQVRSVSSTLHLVERSLGEIERLLAHHRTGITECVVDDLTPDVRQGIVTCCDEMQQAVAALALEVGVIIDHRSLRRVISGQMSIVWVAIEDTKSPGLRGYGPLAEADAVRVDEWLENISRPLLALLRLVSEPTRGRGGASPRISGIL